MKIVANHNYIGLEQLGQMTRKQVKLKLNHNALLMKYQHIKYRLKTINFGLSFQEIQTLQELFELWVLLQFFSDVYMFGMSFYITSGTKK